MVTCPNKKCGSQMPDNYKYCIYCSEKLPQTEANRKQPENPTVSVFDICIAAASVILAASIAISCVILL